MTALRRLGRLLSLPRRRADDPPDPVPGRLFDPLAPSSALPALIVRRPTRTALAHPGECPPTARRGRQPGLESRRGPPGAGRAPHRTGVEERTRASSRHAARTAAPAHHRPAPSFRSAHLHPAHAATRRPALSQIRRPPPTANPTNPDQYRPRTINHVPGDPPKISASPQGSFLTWDNAIACTW